MCKTCSNLPLKWHSSVLIQTLIQMRLMRCFIIVLLIRRQHLFINTIWNICCCFFCYLKALFQTKSNHCHFLRNIGPQKFKLISSTTILTQLDYSALVVNFQIYRTQNVLLSIEQEDKKFSLSRVSRWLVIGTPWIS